MAVKKKEPEYEIQGIPTEISATSRCSVKINDNYYTIETMEKRTISNPEFADMKKEYEDLYDCVNNVTDVQVTAIIDTLKPKLEELNKKGRK